MKYKIFIRTSGIYLNYPEHNISYARNPGWKLLTEVEAKSPIKAMRQTEYDDVVRCSINSPVVRFEVVGENGKSNYYSH